jgi:hypothetical protein
VPTERKEERVAAALPATPSSSGRHIAGVPVVFGLVVLGLAIVAVVVVFLVARRAPPLTEPTVASHSGPPDPHGPLSRGFLPWSASRTNVAISLADDGRCVADLGHPDDVHVVVYAYFYDGGNWMLAAVSSKSGTVLWKNPAFTTDYGAIVCDGHGGVVITNKDNFAVHGIDPATGAERWKVKLRDAPRSVEFGDGCLVVNAIDDSRTSLALVRGTAGPCPSARHLPAEVIAKLDPSSRPASSAWVTERGSLQIGGLTLTFSIPEKGSPRIIVTASRGATKVWEQTLPVASEKYVRRVVTSAGLVVVGYLPGTMSMGLVLLDPATGKILVSREIGKKDNDKNRFVTLVATKKQVLLQYWRKVYGLGLPELNVLWEAGRE